MMLKTIRIIRRFFDGTSGATAVEYAIMLMLIAGACIVTLQLLGNETTGLWFNNSNQIHEVMDEARQ
ncbi:MAG TPA: hypothetical protein PKA83_00570 [Pirellulaceae bacterium]|nr:hypothetical protein [Pirellulaceae bacterium]